MEKIRKGDHVVVLSGRDKGRRGAVLQVLEAGQGLFVGRDGIRPLAAPTLENIPRPDSVPVDTKQLFLGAALDEGQEGLFVFVRDGHIEITTKTETLHLGRGETGFAGIDGATVRPLAMPLFLQFDRIPMPNSRQIREGRGRRIIFGRGRSSPP